MRELADLTAAQPVMQQVGEGEIRFGHFEQPPVRRRQTGELVERVERHELDARALEHGAARHALEDPVQHAIGAAVTVVDRVRQQFAVAVQKSEVHAPRIDADRRRAVFGGLDALGDLVPEAQHVPIDRAVDGGGQVGEAVHFGLVEALAVEPHDHHAP